MLSVEFRSLCIDSLTLLDLGGAARGGGGGAESVLAEFGRFNIVHSRDYGKTKHLRSTRGYLGSFR